MILRGRVVGPPRKVVDVIRRGRGIPACSLLIAAAGEEHGLTALHYDADFDLISAVTGQPCQWMVPAGTVD